MIRKLPAAVLVLLAALPAAAAPIVLKSVSVELPADSDRPLPAGPGQDVFAAACLACHSAGMVINQPRLGRAEWTATVAKMRNAYKAPIDDDDARRIIDYLAAVKGVE